MNLSACLKSSRSNNGRSLSSQYLNKTATMPPWVSFRPRILENSTGPNSVTVARRRAPFSSERVRNSTGLAPAVKGMPMRSWRSSILAWPALGTATPLRSPLMSISREGTPSRDNCSAMICRVLVLPEPVAPAIKPCRFMVLSGTFINELGIDSPPSMAPPRIIEGPLKL